MENKTERGAVGIDLTNVHILPSEKQEVGTLILRYFTRALTREETLEAIQAVIRRRRRVRIRK